MVNFQVYKFLTFFFIVVMIFTHLFWLQKSKNDIIQLNDSRHSTDPNLDARLFTFFTGDTQTVVVVSALLPQKKTQSYFHHFLICLFLHLTFSIIWKLDSINLTKKQSHPPGSYLSSWEVHTSWKTRNSRWDPIHIINAVSQGRSLWWKRGGNMIHYTPWN